MDDSVFSADVSAPDVTRRRKRFTLVGLAALMFVHFVLANAANWDKGATFDENAHIGNGLSFWATGDFRMSPEAVLPQRWMSLPVYLLGYKRPVTDNEVWYRGDVWNYSRELLYKSGNDWQAILRWARAANSLWSVALVAVTFLWARSLFGVAGGFAAAVMYAFSPLVLANAALATTDMATVFAFSASTFALWQLLHLVSPVRLALSTICVGCAFATKSSAVLLIVIGIMMATMRVISREPMLIRFFRYHWDISTQHSQFSDFLNQFFVKARWIGFAVANMRRLLVIGVLVLIHVFVAWVMLWAFFNFRYDQSLNVVEGRDVPFTGSWDDVIKKMQMPLTEGDEPRNVRLANLIQTFRDYHLLPEAYLYVNANGITTTSARSSFLNGRYGILGFPSFFPYCFLYKTPIAVFFLMFAALTAHLTRRTYQFSVERRPVLVTLWNGIYATSPLWFLLIVYWFVSVTSAINIGARHILPTFPATFVLASAAALWLLPLQRGVAAPSTESAATLNPAPAPASGNEPFLAPRLCEVLRAGVIGLFCWLVVGVLWASRPGYLCYFNLIAGGSENGYHHLVDSSLDWGQELPNLKRWLEHEIPKGQRRPRVYVSLFGSTPPSAVGLKDVIWLPSFFVIADLEGLRGTPIDPVLVPGVYCISDTMLQCVYNEQFSGPWRVDLEHNYQVLTQMIQAFMASGSDQIAREAATRNLKTTGIRSWPEAIHYYEVARFGRLCAYLRRKPPDATINNAISIYNLSNEDIRQALVNPPIVQYPKPKEPFDNVPY